jgi:membrane associated rhomboid family serine protease
VSATPSRQPPLLALSLVGVSAALLAAPEFAQALRFERALLLGQPWRLFTGHLVHAPSIALLDLSMLLVLAVWWERRSRVALAWILLASASLASLALVACTSFTSYVGSSALGSGLFVAAALELALEQRGGRRAACVLLLGLFAAKCALEAGGAAPALFASLPAELRVAASAHAAGGAGGALVVLLRRSRRSPSV